MLIDSIEDGNYQKADASSYIYYAAVDDPNSCEQGFGEVTTCETQPSALLGNQLPSESDCYYFCPDVPNCLDLTMEEIANLACLYAADHEFPSYMGLRSLCGPETATEHGPCCFGLDAAPMVNQGNRFSDNWMLGV